MQRINLAVEVMGMSWGAEGEGGRGEGGGEGRGEKIKI